MEVTEKTKSSLQIVGVVALIVVIVAFAIVLTV